MCVHLCACACVLRDRDEVMGSCMNVGKPNRVCHFGSTGCQHRGAAVVKTMTFLFASMSLAEPKRCPVDLGWLWEGIQTQKGQTAEEKKKKKSRKSLSCEKGGVSVRGVCVQGDGGSNEILLGAIVTEKVREGERED